MSRPRTVEQILAGLKLLVFDCDGVLTDGKVIYHDDGTETKHFNVRDGHAIRMAQRNGLTLGVLTGRRSRVVENRMRDLGIEHLEQLCWNKHERLADIAKAVGVKLSETAFMGDDLVDLKAMATAGMAAAPADACNEVLQAADWVAEARGGEGAVREFIEAVMKAQGTWQRELDERYRIGT